MAKSSSRSDGVLTLNFQSSTLKEEGEGAALSMARMDREKKSDRPNMMSIVSSVASSAEALAKKETSVKEEA